MKCCWWLATLVETTRTVNPQVEMKDRHPEGALATVGIQSYLAK